MIAGRIAIAILQAAVDASPPFHHPLPGPCYWITEQQDSRKRRWKIEKWFMLHRDKGCFSTGTYTIW